MPLDKSSGSNNSKLFFSLDKSSGGSLEGPKWNYEELEGPKWNLWNCSCIFFAETFFSFAGFCCKFAAYSTEIYPCKITQTKSIDSSRKKATPNFKQTKSCGNPKKNDSINMAATSPDYATQVEKQQKMDISSWIETSNPWFLHQSTSTQTHQVNMEASS